MKAAVFCNFPAGLGEKLKSELIDRGVVIEHFGVMDTHTKVSNPGCEAIIAFYEIMSHGQTDKAKAWAREWGVPFFLLSRKSSTWGKQLPAIKAKVAVPEPVKSNGKPKSLTYTETIVHPPEVVEEAPPSIQPPVVDEALERQWDEIKELFIEEVESLKSDKEELETRLAEASRQRTYLVSQVEDFKKRVESKEHQVTELKKEVSELQTLRDQVQAYKKVYEEIKSQLETERAAHALTRETLQGQMTDTVSHADYAKMVDAYEENIAKLKETITKAPVATVDPTIASIQHLFNMKMLDEETAGKMLVKAILHTK